MNPAGLGPENDCAGEVQHLFDRKSFHFGGWEINSLSDINEILRLLQITKVHYRGPLIL
jgi:hypothetical protein